LRTARAVCEMLSAGPTTVGTGSAVREGSAVALRRTVLKKGLCVIR